MNLSESLVFAGSPAFAARILQALLDAGARPELVLTQPDRPAGRGKRLTPCPVKTLALDAGIEVMDPPSLRPGADDRGPRGAVGTPPDVARERLVAMRPTLMIVAAYGLILPPDVLEVPHLGCINVHASLLPRWRGAAPVERAIMAGDAETGVCIMQMEAGLDTGPVWLRRSTPIGALETGGALEARLAELGATALLEALPLLETSEPAPQDPAGVTYADKLTRADAGADFGLDAASLARRIRALNPRLPVTATTDDVRVRLLLADDDDAEPGAEPGTVVGADRDGIRLACGRGTLRVLRAQVLRGKARELDARELLNGFADLFRPGQRFHGV